MIVNAYPYQGKSTRRTPVSSDKQRVSQAALPSCTQILLLSTLEHVSQKTSVLNTTICHVAVEHHTDEGPTDFFDTWMNGTEDETNQKKHDFILWDLRGVIEWRCKCHHPPTSRL